MADLRPRLTGQGNYGPLRLPRYKGPMHLWNHHQPPPAQNTVVVMKDGTVVEGHEMSYEQMYGPLVHRVFVGGYVHVCNVEEDPLSWASLKAKGYKCEVATQDIYLPNDKHSDDYPVVDGSGNQQARAEALEQARQRRISALEAELAALKGFAP